MAQLELEAETLRAGLGASRSVIVTRSIASSGPFWQSPGGACPRGVIELLRSTPAKDRVVRARWYEQRRAREAARARAHPVEPEDEEDEPPPLPSAADLKSLYRRLARRFHPDLARTEEEQVRHAEVMSRLNALSRTTRTGTGDSCASRSTDGHCCFSRRPPLRLLVQCLEAPRPP